MSAPSILYLVPDLVGAPGGIARYCRMICRALIEADIKPEVMALMDQQTAVSEAKDIFPSLSYHPCRGSRLLFMWRALVAILRSRPTLILVGHPNFSLLGWLLARVSGAKFVVFMYGTDVWQPLKPPRRWALRKADQFISISNFTAKRAIEANRLPSDKIRILPNCLDVQFENQHERADLQHQDSLSILTVSRITLFEPYKGHEYVIQAMPQLLKRFPDLVYNVVGDGDRRPALEKLAADEGISHAIRFHGIVSDEMLAKLYRQASAFVMPSLVEGFGFVFLEAMAQGTPAIGGNKDAAPEVIVDGETGYVVDPTSVPAITEAIARLLSDSTLRHRMGQAAMQRAKEQFGFSHFQKELHSYLSELMPEIRAGTDLQHSK